jgi:hypothetical protein
MFMASILPRFKQFCIDEIFARNYDYLVPLESKGVLLLNQVLRENPEQETRVRYLRAFDFDEPSSVAGKRIAIIDDTVVYGRALANAKGYLKARGATHVDKYACMLRLDPDAPKTMDDVTVASKVSLLQYDLMLEELSALTVQHRPAFPDHLSFVARFSAYSPAQSLVLSLRTIGILAEHRRTRGYVDYSLHYPHCAPLLPEQAADTGPNKLRFRLSGDEQHLTFTPGMFPSITAPEELLGKDELFTTFYNSLARPWHSPDVKSLNLYEAFTLTIRARMAANFVVELERLGFAIADINLPAGGIMQYYGPTVGPKILEIAGKYVSGRRPSPALPPTTPSDQAVEAISLTQQLLHITRDAYVDHNHHIKERGAWESAGLNIEELAARTHYPRDIVSYGIELLNDYGHVVPMQITSGVQRLERVYRSTEVGGRKLATAYGAPDC